jgi:large conductance mechanosensitive channel
VLKGFREFVLRGNVVELAVAFVMGAAFQAVVSSFTEDMLTPLLGLFGVGGVGDLAWTTPGGAVVAYGSFLNALISFLIVAAVVYFFLVAPMNALEARRQAGTEPATPTTKTCPQCASEIPIAARRCPLCTSDLS